MQKERQIENVKMIRTMRNERQRPCRKRQKLFKNEAAPTLDTFDASDDIRDLPRTRRVVTAEVFKKKQ
jgi:hypothetical protein